MCIKFKNYLISYNLKKTPVVCILETKKVFDYVAMIGTILAGGHYVPINKEMPLKNINNVAKISKANFIIVDETNRDLTNRLTSKLIILEKKKFY